MTWKRASVFDALDRIGGEFQSSGRAASLDELVQPRLVDRNLALIEAGRLGRIDVDANDIVAGVSQGRPR